MSLSSQATRSLFARCVARSRLCGPDARRYAIARARNAALPVAKSCISRFVPFLPGGLFFAFVSQAICACPACRLLWRVHRPALIRLAAADMVAIIQIKAVIFCQFYERHVMGKGAGDRDHTKQLHDKGAGAASQSGGRGTHALPMPCRIDLDDLGKAVRTCLTTIRRDAPLVHNITNMVVANLTANMLLAIGASPAMVDSPPEAGELAAIAGALVVNLGTLNLRQTSAIEEAVAAARSAGVPIVLDPVGVGLLSMRTALAHRLLDCGLAVIRGNASEIMALGGAGAGGKGVDATEDSAAALEAAHALAVRSNAVVAVSGMRDYVTDGADVVAVCGGHPMMPQVTGLGCSVTALAGAALAACPDHLAATVAAHVFMGAAGAQAGAKARGPGDLGLRIVDELYALSPGSLDVGAHIVHPASASASQ